MKKPADISKSDIDRVVPKIGIGGIGGGAPVTNLSVTFSPGRFYSYSVEPNPANPGPSVYFFVDEFDGGLRQRTFSDTATFSQLTGLSTAAANFITGIDSRAIAAIPNALAVPSGSFLAQSPTSGTVWLVDGGTLRGITSAQAFVQYNFSWAAIRLVPQDLLNELGSSPEFYINAGGSSVTWNPPA